MNANLITALSWHRGTLPDRYWYQLNGKSATENYADQKQTDESDEEELLIISEVRMK